MEGVLHGMRREAERTSNRIARTKIGTISSYDPASHAVKVMAQPENYETGWMPLASPWVGNGWGMFAAPAVGDQVVIHFQEGGYEAGVAAERLYSDADRPLNVPSGEFWLVHEKGAKIRLRNDGSVEIYGADIKVGPENATLLTLVTQTFQALFNSHTHPGNGAPPTQHMTAAHLTTALKGG